MYLRCVRACVVSLRECVPFVVCGVCVWQARRLLRARVKWRGWRALEARMVSRQAGRAARELADRVRIAVRTLTAGVPRSVERQCSILWRGHNLSVSVLGV